MKKVKIFAFISAITTALLLFVYLNSLNRPVETARTTVVTVALHIPADTPITAEMLALTALPAEAVLADAAADMSEVIGKITKSEMYVGEQLLKSKLISPGSSGSDTLAYAIEPGMRAITLGVSETAGLAYMITPGNHIDIIGEFLYEETADTAESSGEDGTAAASGDGEKKSYTTIVLENITVLAVDRVLSEKGKIKSESPTYTTLTLQVTPRQAMELSMAQFEGQLRAILRSPLDEKLTNLPSVTLDDIMVK